MNQSFWSIIKCKYTNKIKMFVMMTGRFVIMDGLYSNVRVMNGPCNEYNFMYNGDIYANYSNDRFSKYWLFYFMLFLTCKVQPEELCYRCYHCTAIYHDVT